MIKAVIIDDEPPARRELTRLLAAQGAWNIVGEAGDIAVARGLLQRTRPDVVFLDIELGGHSGFELIDEIDPETAIVFVTAYDQYAVRAFESSAVDYLLKPVDAERLAQTAERVRDRVTRAAPSVPAVFRNARWLFLDTSNGPEFVSLDTVTHIEASGRSTRVFTQDGHVRTAARTIGDWESRLVDGNFVRVHRSTIVNLVHVVKVERWMHYGYRLLMNGASEPVTMSRRYAVLLRDRMQ